VKTDGFLTYTEKYLPKVNSIRRIISAPDVKGVPVLGGAAVLFSSAASAHNEPRSCYNCPFYNYGRSCQLIGQGIAIRKLTWPAKPTSDSKPIEYWPVCGYWVYGTPNYGSAKSVAELDPDTAGLCWINAPKVGQTQGGSCCGGRNGGDDCDLWMTPSADKRDEDEGFCRVLQRNTSNMDCCTGWRDDDLVDWKTAQERING
jgi:hypothetical protein